MLATEADLRGEFLLQFCCNSLQQPSENCPSRNLYLAPPLLGASMASITERGLFQWQAIVRRRGFATETKTFETEPEAREWAATVEAKMLLNQHADNRQFARTTLGQLLDRYGEFIKERNLGAKQELKRVAQSKKRPLSERYVLSLTPYDFEQYEIERLKSVGANTVRLELCLMRSAFERAIKKWGLQMQNPVGSMDAALPSGRDRRLVGDEEARLLAAARADGRFPLELEMAILLAIETGLREGRLATLSWADVDLDTGVVKVLSKNPRKGEMKAVAVPLSNRAAALLRNLSRSIKGRVFGEAFETGDDLGRAFRHATKRAGIHGLTFHDLRHEAASRLAPHMNAQTLAKVMTWKSIQMAMRYYNPLDSELVEARRRAETLAEMSAENRAFARQGALSSGRPHLQLVRA
jgi:integrase